MRSEFGSHEPIKPTPAEVLTLPVFEERWGETCGIEPNQLQGLWNLARRHSADLPYHNWSHTVETLWKTMELADECEKRGIEVNRKVLVGAALFHDAFYDRSYSRSGFPSRETHSAHIFGSYAHAFGFREDETKLGVDAIEVTERGKKPVTIEDKILLRADLDNVGHDFNTSFFPKTLNIFKEYSQGIMPKDDQLWTRFKEQTVLLLANYLENDLSLGEFDRYNTYKRWVNTAHTNLINMAVSIETGRISSDLIEAVGRIATVDEPPAD